MYPELWEPLNGRPGYEISTHGHLRYKGKERRGSTNKAGYCIAHFLKNKKHSNVYMHTLVAQTFIGLRQPHQRLRFIDGDKTNCRLDNIQYITYSLHVRLDFATGVKGKKRLSPIQPRGAADPSL